MINNNYTHNFSWSPSESRLIFRFLENPHHEDVEENEEIDEDEIIKQLQKLLSTEQGREKLKDALREIDTDKQEEKPIGGHHRIISKKDVIDPGHFKHVEGPEHIGDQSFFRHEILTETPLERAKNALRKQQEEVERNTDIKKAETKLESTEEEIEAFDFDKEFLIVMNPGGFEPFPSYVFNWSQLKTLLRRKCEKHMQGKKGKDAQKALYEVRTYLEGLRDYGIVHFGFKPKKHWRLQAQKDNNTNYLINEYINSIDVGDHRVPIDYFDGRKNVLNGIQPLPSDDVIGKYFVGPEVTVQTALMNQLVKAFVAFERKNSWSESFSDLNERHHNRAKQVRARKKAQAIMEVINENDFDSVTTIRLTHWAIREIDQFGDSGSSDIVEHVTSNLITYRIPEEKKRLKIINPSTWYHWDQK